MPTYHERTMNGRSGKAAMNQHVEVVDLTGDDSLPSYPTKLAKQPKAQATMSTINGPTSMAYPPSHMIDLPSMSSQKAASSKQPRKRKAQDLTTDPKPAPKRKKAEPQEEKRLKRWRTHPPQSYGEIRERALTQRMFVVDRQRTTSPDQSHPIETATIVGTTGNVYTVTVSKVPTCDCPHARKGNQCKHIVYVLSRVLRAPSHLEYQLAFTSSELVQIFQTAPPLPSETAEDSSKDGHRKDVEGECPICCADFEKGEKIVWCRAACGNNIHKECFDQWAATKRGQTVTCPFCRAAWEGEKGDAKAAVSSGRVNAEGYVNVAGAFGLSGRRDYSTYHDYWVRRQIREGLIVDDDGYGYDDFDL